MNTFQMFFVLTWLLVGSALASPGIPSPKYGGMFVTIQDQGFLEVITTFKVPNVTLAGDDKAHVNELLSYSAWAGIGGLTPQECQNGSWHAGIGWTYSNNAWEYYAFYQWSPGPEIKTSLVVEPGDSVTVVVVADYSMGGTFKIINRSTHERVKGGLQHQPAICLNTAAWVVNNQESKHPGLTMPNFGSVQFHDTFAYPNVDPLSINGTSGVPYVLTDDHTIYTNTTTTYPSTITVEWVDIPAT